jgi:hypothetical protein
MSGIGPLQGNTEQMHSAMNDLTLAPDTQIRSGACPMHVGGDVCRVVSPCDDLVVLKHRRMVVQYSTDSAGATELHLYYGPRQLYRHSA